MMGFAFYDDPAQWAGLEVEPGGGPFGYVITPHGRQRIEANGDHWRCGDARPPMKDSARIATTTAELARLRAQKGGAV